jgi:hypothetical protein
LYYTGNFSTFTRNFTLREVKAMYKSIKDTILEIQAYDHDEVELSNELTARLLKLRKKRDKLDVKIKAIENDLKATLSYKGSTYGSSDHLTATLVKRAQYTYSDKVSALEKELKRMKAQERKEGASKDYSDGGIKINPIKQDYGRD